MFLYLYIIINLFIAPSLRDSFLPNAENKNSNSYFRIIEIYVFNKRTSKYLNFISKFMGVFLF